MNALTEGPWSRRPQRERFHVGQRSCLRRSQTAKGCRFCGRSGRRLVFKPQLRRCARLRILYDVKTLSLNWLRRETPQSSAETLHAEDALADDPEEHEPGRFHSVVRQDGPLPKQCDCRRECGPDAPAKPSPGPCLRHLPLWKKTPPDLVGPRFRVSFQHSGGPECCFVFIHMAKLLPLPLRG